MYIVILYNTYSSLQELKDLKSQFNQLLTNNSQPLSVFLDSLDQLRDAGSGLKDWIPSSLPDSTILLMSAIPGEEYKVEPDLRVMQN